MERLVSIIYDEIVKSCECKGAGCSRCLNRFRTALRKIHAHVPRKYLNASVSYIRDIALREKLTTFVTNINKQNGLFIYGEPGTGKTYVLCAVLSELLKKGLSAKYVTCSDLISEIQRGWYDDRCYDDVVAPKVDVDVLAIDDMRLNLTDKGTQALEDFLKKRNDEGKLCLVASRVSLGDLESLLGDKISVLRSYYKIVLQKNVQSTEASTK